MADPNLLYLSLASVSSVLLGICVTLRNNAFATILRHYEEEITLGGKDYETILERSAFGAMGAGLFFAGSIASSFFSLFYGQSTLRGPGFKLAIGTFLIGLLILLYSLFAGYIKRPDSPFRSPSKPDRSERPEVEVGDEE